MVWIGRLLVFCVLVTLCLVSFQCGGRCKYFSLALTAGPFLSLFSSLFLLLKLVDLELRRWRRYVKQVEVTEEQEEEQEGQEEEEEEDDERGGGTKNSTQLN